MSVLARFAAEIAKAVSEGIGGALSGAVKGIWHAFLSFVYGFVGEGLSELFHGISGIGTALFDLPWVQAAVGFFSRFGLCLYLVGAAVAVFDVALDYRAGEGLQVRRHVLPLLLGFLATGLFARVPVLLFRYCVDLQHLFSSELLNTFVQDPRPAGEILAGTLADIADPMSGLKGLLILVCLLYGVVKCFLDNIKRGGILLLQISVGSLHMFALARGQTQGFFGWCRQILAVCFTAFMQNTFLLMGLYTLGAHPLLGAGLVLAAGEVPRIAQQFGLETGMRVNVTSAAFSASRVLSLAKAAVR